MGDLSLNFSTHEFNCKHCGRRVGPTQDLVAMLQRVRTAIGKPLVIVSGYRCNEHNRAVGGMKSSQHLVGNAADIPGGVVSIAVAKKAGAHGIGVRAGRVIHLDMTPGWSGVFED